MNILDTKVTRKIDAAGRISIPAQFRKKYQITEEELYPFYVLTSKDGNACYLAIKVNKPANSNPIKNILKDYSYNNLDELMKDIADYSYQQQNKNKNN